MLLIYENENVYYICKEGKIRPMASQGERQSSTIRKGFSFKLYMILNRNQKLEIKKFDSTHTFHIPNKQTYLHYTQNLKLTQEEEEMAKKMIDCGGKKSKIKLNLMVNREAPVSLKTLHNVQTKMNRSLNTDDDELTSMINAMKKSQVQKSTLHTMKELTT